MPFLSTALFVLLTATLTPAQTTQSVLTITLLGYDISPSLHLDGSLIGLSPDSLTTTLALACAPGTDADECGLFPSQTLTVGPSIYQMVMGEADEYTGTQSCQFTSATMAVCAESEGGEQANDPGVSTTTYTQSDLGVVPVTITAGPAAAEGSATAVAGSTATGSDGGASSSSASASAASSASSGDATVTSAPASTAASTSPSSASGTGAAASSTSSGLAAGGISAPLGAIAGAVVGVLGHVVMHV